jgi:16S rRNA processing protein RimM
MVKEGKNPTVKQQRDESIMATTLLGVIIGAHGIKGGVKIKSFTENPLDVGAYGPLTSLDGREFELVKRKLANDDVVIASLKGVTDRNTSETLKGIELFIDREKLPKLPDGEFYVSELMGRNALNGITPFGTICGIQNFGAGDLLEVKQKKGEPLLVPMRFVVTREPDVVFDLPEGFLDLSVKRDPEEDAS